MENKTLLSKGYHHCFDIFSRHTKACTFFDTLKKIQIYLFNLLVSTLQVDYHTVSKFLAVLITSFQKQMFSSTILGGQIVCKHLPSSNDAFYQLKLASFCFFFFGCANLSLVQRGSVNFPDGDFLSLACCSRQDCFYLITYAIPECSPLVMHKHWIRSLLR